MTLKLLCVHNSISNLSLVVTTGTSPYHVSTPTPGRYSLLILAEHSQQTASLLLWFNIRPASGRLEVTTLQRSILSNASVLVEFGANKAGAEFQCSTGDDPFKTCECIYDKSMGGGRG